MDTISSAASLADFDRTLRTLLSELEESNKGIRRLHGLAAAPISAAVALGRAHDPHVHPSLVIYDRHPSGYYATLEILVKLLAFRRPFSRTPSTSTRHGSIASTPHVSAIVSCIEKDTVLGELVEGHIPQGSWPHRTIITPVGNHEFDADFLIQLTEVTEWSADPKIYLQQLRAACKRSSTL